MKKECKVMRFLNSVASAFCILFATASYAFANNTPSGAGVVSLLIEVFLILIIFNIGGGYAVLNKLDARKPPVSRIAKKILAVAAGLILIFFGLASGFWIFAMLIFVIYAIGRGVNMIKWSREAKKDRVRLAHLEGVNPKKLKTAGIILIVLTMFVFGYSLINIEEMAGLADSRKRGNVRGLNAVAKKAHTAATAYLKKNPKAEAVTCADIEKEGYEPWLKMTCLSNMTKSSGGITISGPELWGLKNPKAVITYSGELTPAEP